MGTRPDHTEISITFYNKLLSSLTLAAVAVTIAFIILSVTVNNVFAWGLLLAVLLLLAIYYFSIKRRKLNFLLTIRSDWGKNQVTKEWDLKSIRTLFDHVYATNDNISYIDEQTWKDLNMDYLYAKIDRTYTDPGEAVLYRMLREPLFDKEKLVERDRTIRFFQNNKEAREKIQYTLVRLGHQSVHNDIFTLLWREKFSNSRFKLLFTVLAFAALISLILPFAFWSAYLVPVPVAIFIINLMIHFSVERKKDMETVSFPYLVNCIKTAKELSAFKYEEIRVYTQKFKDIYKASAKILGKARFLFTSNAVYIDPTNNFFLQYLNIFFLVEVRAFYGTVDEIAHHISQLRELYLTLGELDALQAVGSYRASLSIYTVPEFVNEGITLELKEAVQPLLDKPVPASVSFKKNIVIITGSNMGGKSTFLRNLGNNVLMAQTIATTTASQYRGSFFHIISSISRTDDLMAGKSFYYVEAERILRVIRSFNEKTPTLCIIDEMLSGTNSNERLLASEAIIRYLAGQNTLAIIATHDIELAGKLKNTCDFYHFTDAVDENGLKFDYLLKSGIATTHNAIQLLKYLGYPKEITGT